MTEEYWLSAYYAHQAQQKPDQPDNSWDPYGPGDYPWWTGPEWTPGGWPVWDWGSGPAGCPQGPYLMPGDQYEMAGSTFYPGDVHLLSGTYPSSANSALLSAGGTTYTVAAGSSFTAGAMSNYAMYMPTPPTITQGKWDVRVRGTGTLSLTMGKDVDSWWDWYSGGNGSIEWLQPETYEIDSSDFLDAWISTPPALFDNVEYDTYVLKVEVLSGTLEFDFVAMSIAGAAGFHRQTGETVLRTHTAGLPQQSLSNSTGRLFGARSLGFKQEVATQTTYGSGTGWWQDWESVPMDDINAARQIGTDEVKQLPSTSGLWANALNNSRVVPQLVPTTWQASFAGTDLYGTPFMGDWQATAHGAASIKVASYAHCVKFMPEEAPRPSIPNHETFIAGLHFSGSVQYLNSMSSFISWVSSANYVTGSWGITIGNQQTIDGLGAPHSGGNFFATAHPGALQPGDLIPSTPGAVVLSSLSEPPGSTETHNARWNGTGPESVKPQYSDMGLDVTVPYQDFTAVLTTDGLEGGNFALQFDLNYGLPPFTYNSIVWEYLGGGHC